MKPDSSSPSAGRERELFLAALERPAHERAEFVRRATGGDHELRERLESLLTEQETTGSFLETPAVERPLAARLSQGGTLVVSTETLATETAAPGEMIGPYKILQVIGEGGCGVVYMADQERPVRRRVALKIIKLGMDSKTVIARFEAERQALAMMDHPNIARVLDAGATETGRPYFVMELVRGVRITEYCDKNNLPTEERLKLVIRVCQAIQHAHQKGVIHRDIKPSNILVTLHDGVPVPKVIDFGIAKATEQRLTELTLFTEFHAFIGTPAYMSPEQAEMSGLDIDTRSDIYSLGVLLYEILVGKTPFDPEALVRNGLDECRRTIREVEPSRPSTRAATLEAADLTTTATHRCTEAAALVHQLRGDLDWIVMKCLEKDRTRRYDTAAALAADVQRYLDNEPVSARPPSTVYKLQKFLRKHRGPVAAAATIAFLLVAGSGVSAWLAVRATQAEQEAVAARQLESNQRRIAEREREAARLNEYVADINLAQQSLKEDNIGRAILLLNKHRPEAGETDLRGFEWFYLWDQAKGDPHTELLREAGPIRGLSASPDGDHLAVSLDRGSSGQDPAVHVWDLRSRERVASIGRPVHPLNGGPRGDGRRSFRGRRGNPWRELEGAFLREDAGLVVSAPGSLRVVDPVTGGLVRSLEDGEGPFQISPDGRFLVAPRSGFGRGNDGGSLLVFRSSDWRVVNEIPDAESPLAVSSDGKRIAYQTQDGVWVAPLTGPDEPVLLEATEDLGTGNYLTRMFSTFTFNPDGTKLVGARNEISERGVFVIGVWDAVTGREEGVMPGDPEVVEHLGIISSVAFSADGNTLATGSLDYSIRLWDFQKREPIRTLRGHHSEVWSIAFSADGRSLYSGDKGGSVYLWSLDARPKPDTEPGVAMPFAYGADGRRLALLTADKMLVVRDLETGRTLNQFTLPRYRGHIPPAVATDAGLTMVAIGQHDGKVTLHDVVGDGERTLQISDRGPVDSLALTPDGRTLITSRNFAGVQLHDLRDNTTASLDSKARHLLVSPDGTTLAAISDMFSDRHGVELWDLETTTLRTNLVLAAEPGFGAAFTPEGDRLAIAFSDDKIRLFATSTGELLGEFSGHKQGVYTLAFSPDGKTLASSSSDSTTKLWNVATRQELLSDRRLGGALVNLLFSPDGERLIGGLGAFNKQAGLRFYSAPRGTD